MDKPENISPAVSIICPLCLNHVEQLKTNSHIIPRFMMKKTKVNGQNVVFSNATVIEKNQKDLMADIVCSKCELRFKDNDDFAKHFFEFQKYTKLRHEYPSKTSYGKKCGYEDYDSSSYQQLVLFLISLFLRHHLYLAKEETKNLLGPHYDELRLIYLSGIVSSEVYPVCMVRYYNFDGIGYPTVERSGGINSVFVLVQSYRIWMYVDRRHIYEKAYEPFVLTPTNVRALLIDLQDSKMLRDIFDVIKKAKK